MSTYAQSTDIVDELGEAYLSSSDLPANVAQLLDAASRLIDAEVGRWDNFFYPSTADETRYYDGSNGREQEIDEFVSITSVSVAELGGLSSSDYTAWSSTDYFTEPYNKTPKNKLVVDNINGSKVYWPYYRKSVQVVGVPGWSTTPPTDVAQACRIQVARWIQRAKQNWQDNGASVEIGSLKVTAPGNKLDGDIKALLARYVRELMP